MARVVTVRKYTPAAARSPRPFNTNAGTTSVNGSIKINNTTDRYARTDREAQYSTVHGIEAGPYLLLTHPLQAHLHPVAVSIPRERCARERAPARSTSQTERLTTLHGNCVDGRNTQIVYRDYQDLCRTEDRTGKRKVHESPNIRAPWGKHVHSLAIVCRRLPFNP
jgi:hypothetical protein